jgi:penicillin-binding protein 1A
LVALRREGRDEAEAVHASIVAARSYDRRVTGTRRPRWTRCAVSLAVAVTLGALTGMGVSAAIHVPRVEGLAEYRPPTISRLLDRDGRVFATYASERRILLTEDEIPDLLRQAILAAEDANFFGHGGVDAQGVFRAALSNALQGTRQGGSTLTMQLARKLYLTPEKTWRRKIEEALLSVEIEKRFSKQQIFTLYCNLMYLGHGNYGMAAAARAYFGKHVRDLTLAEAASLAGILQRPGAYSPHRRPDLVLQRRDYVLRRMLEERYIDRDQAEAALRTPLVVLPEETENAEAPYFAEEVRRDLAARLGADVLLRDGLEVRTTLDAGMQAAAEAALRYGLLRLDHRKGWRGPLERLHGVDLDTHVLPSWAHVDPGPGTWNQGIVLAADADRARVKIGASTFRLEGDGIRWTGRDRVSFVVARGDVAWFRFPTREERDEDLASEVLLEQEPVLEGAAVILDSATGAVRALVGGWDFGRSEFNRGTQARRQTGSAFKPFVYGAALEWGFTPADTLFDAPAVFPGAAGLLDYSPRNYYRRYEGIVTLRRALEQSLNVTTAKLQDLVGVDRVIDFARRCGMPPDLPPYPSLGLGVADLTPLELAGAYAAIANQGVRFDPYLIESIHDATGSLRERHQALAQRAMDPQVAYVLTHMLEGVIDRGTAASAADLPLDLAGKTGTQDEYTDAWFAGFTPRTTIVVWVGYDEKKPIGRNMTGAEAALPMWRRIVELGLAEGWILEGERFTPPPGVLLTAVESRTGLLPGPGATHLVEEAFVAGTEPDQAFDPKWLAVSGLPWYQQRPFYLPKQGERMPEAIADWSLVEAAWEEKEEARERRP